MPEKNASPVRSEISPPHPSGGRNWYGRNYESVTVHDGRSRCCWLRPSSKWSTLTGTAAVYSLSATRVSESNGTVGNRFRSLPAGSVAIAAWSARSPGKFVYVNSNDGCPADGFVHKSVHVVPFWFHRPVRFISVNSYYPIWNASERTNYRCTDFRKRFARWKYARGPPISSQVTNDTYGISGSISSGLCFDFQVYI